ncbi:Phosphatidylinositolglycan class N-domain-containing protein [Hysterangium stoloniferum]|nr:Phosphatidylinositolglycan class N-domain-containing protein [Hysterangium stoloniferum]
MKSRSLKVIATSPNTGRLLILGLVFHIVYIMSVFDCYFTSPVVHGMKHFSTEVREADRLVLIVGDGLRADLLFNTRPFPSIPGSPEVVAPHLRSIVENRGVFGISHTRVPTESRPGHVAIIAGMYEDVSAVTKGWKTNPVDFDSVFNQSTKTFSFGSPDILPMFARGATPGKVLTWCYDENDEDFTKDATSLDTWVLDKMKLLFQNATTDPELDAQLRSPGIVFFLHLLGLDTTGHSYRPHSKEYMKNIQHVDSIVKQTESLFRSFYGAAESRTAYIFTADHGMSNVGNHGDGEPDNTRTPLIAWGSGIRGPKQSTSGSPSFAWNLTLQAQDVSQADIAPLMTTLIGRPFPVNSVGVLPDVYGEGILSPAGGEEARARAAVVNAKVILEQYRVKHTIKSSHALSYKPFPLLKTESSDPGSSELENLDYLLTQKLWSETRHAAAGLIDTTLKGLRYLQTYDRQLLRTIVTAGYAGWSIFSALFVIQHYGVSLPSTPSSRIPRLVAFIVFLAASALFAIRRSPITYYMYIAFPIYFWGEILQKIGSYLTYKADAMPFNRMSVWKNGVTAGLIIVALQAMVAGYTHRAIWSLGFLIIGIIWPLFSFRTAYRSQDTGIWIAWTLSCLVTAVFPLLSVEKTASVSTILIGGSLMCFVGVAMEWALSGTTPRMFSHQVFLIVISMLTTSSSIKSLQSKLGLPLMNQITAWILFIISPLLPFLNSSSMISPHHRLLSLFLSLCPCFVILSISVEGLFFITFSATLTLWIEIEGRIRGGRKLKKTNLLRADDIRASMFFLFFVQVAFFGTGNVASISSFYLEPVYRLVPVFNPFLMASLLIFKIVSPYIILSATFATLTARLNLPPFSLFLVALSLTDGMTLTFFYNVTDSGSWLEIGQTISFFCITSLLLVWSAGVCVAGEWLMGGTLQAAGLASENVREKQI